MDRASVELIITRYAAGGRADDFVIFNVGDSTFQSRCGPDGVFEINYLDEADPAERRAAVHALLARYGVLRADADGTDPDDRSIFLGPGQRDGVRACMIAMIDVLQDGDARPLKLDSGEGAHMPKRKGLFGLGGWAAAA